MVKLRAIEGCSHCGKGTDVVYECFNCSRAGCNACMPNGKDCLCPECEQHKQNAKETIENIKKEVGGIGVEGEGIINSLVGAMSRKIRDLPDKIEKDTVEGFKAALELAYCEGKRKGWEILEGKGDQLVEYLKEPIIIKVPECPKCGWVFN